MNLFDTEHEAQFRATLKAWLAENLPGDLPAAIHEAIHSGNTQPSRAWQRKLWEAGYAARSWPVEYGGRAASFSEDLILFEELPLAGAPNDIFRVGMRIIGPMLATLGTDEQKREYLPRMVDGTLLWSQAFSEPSAGSDLASLKTRAEMQKDGYRINGQKIWNTFGHLADYTLLLARTEPGLAKHKGLTAFAVRLDSPGITVRPIQQMSGRSDFNEIFFDDVRLPHASVIGGVNNGWKVATTMLDFERRAIARAGFECRANYINLLRLLRKLRNEPGNAALSEPSIDSRLAELGIQTEIAVFNNFRFAAKVPPGEKPGPEASIQKLHSTELNKSIYALTLEVIMRSRPSDTSARMLPQINEDYLGAFGFTIGGGTAQIQRNIIAERLLQLPRQS